MVEKPSQPFMPLTMTLHSTLLNASVPLDYVLQDQRWDRVPSLEYKASGGAMASVGNLWTTRSINFVKLIKSTRLWKLGKSSELNTPGIF